MEFQLEIDLEFTLNMFKSKFIHSTHLSIIKPLNMVFEHLWNLFNLENLPNGFSQLLMVCSYVVKRCIPKNIVKALNVAKLLTFAQAF
jgi:hypothetical protein